jgi:hypothetical protein
MISMIYSWMKVLTFNINRWTCEELKHLQMSGWSLAVRWSHLSFLVTLDLGNWVCRVIHKLSELLWCNLVWDMNTFYWGVSVNVGKRCCTFKFNSPIFCVLFVVCSCVIYQRSLGVRVNSWSVKVYPII